MPGFPVDFGQRRVHAAQCRCLLQRLPVEIEGALWLVGLHARFCNQEEPAGGVWRKSFQLFEVVVGEAFVAQSEPVPGLGIFRVQFGQSLKLLCCIRKAVERQQSLAE